MKLLVRVIEAKNIPALDPNGFSDPYVKLQLGRQRFRSKVVKKCLNPSWCEEFIFKVDDLKEELLITVLDEDKYFNDDFVGQIKVPIIQVLDAKDKSLGTAWYTLQPKTKKAKNKDCGEILLTICFSQNNTLLDVPPVNDPVTLPRKYADTPSDTPSRSSPLWVPSPMRSEEVAPQKEDKWNASALAGRIAQIFNKNVDSASVSSVDPSDASDVAEGMDFAVPQNNPEEQNSSVDFDEMMKSIEMRDPAGEAPTSLPGGVVLDQLYAIPHRELNSLLFSPESEFLKTFADLEGSTDLEIGPWKYENNGESLKRVVCYTKAPSKLIKALKAIEEHTYLKADTKAFAVLSSVSTPDAPYGKSFKVEVLYCITPGPEQPSGEQSSRLEVSWRVNFLQSTMMKSMIEGGARQGIKDSFKQYDKLLSQNVKPLDLQDVGSEKDQLLASLQVEPQSDWKLAVQYFANFTVASTFLMGLYVLTHIWLAMPSTIQGLEFAGLDLPDSIGEVIVCCVLVLQGKRVLEFMSRFMQARVQKGSDHGIKAQGDGWLLTVALVEGSNLAAVDSSGYSDPYVVFTCNGKTRTSSIKFQKSKPHWNEIFEFDAMNEPPSVLEVDVFDFDGPFDDATSLGRAEINFLKSNITDLSDIWIPLEGKLAQACQSKLHLRIFLNNNKGSNVVKDYITKMEKEVGKKIRLRSPQTNSAFQKLFALPPEEFLINDFSCHLKRKMPLQGRLFLSARIIGFHADLFGHKTKFFFLWEDIEDIQVIPPTLSSMGSPIIIITLWPGKGFDARHGARTQDDEGRLKFHFHSFVSYNVAHRTIMALWKARALTPEQKVQIADEESEANTAVEEEALAKNLPATDEEVEAKSQAVDEESEAKSLRTEESGSFLGVEDVNMSMVYSSILSLPTSFFMELFRGSEIDRRVMERTGCLNYTHSPWESEKADVYQRQLYYKFDKRISRYRGEVTSTQQKSRLSGKQGWLIEEIMTLHGIPLGDYFTVEDLPSRSVGCSIQVYFGIAWLKYTRHQKRITKNIVSNLQDRLKVMFSVLEKEYVSGT
ncbi:C2 and GRAM domain-containing protein At1g03370-like isoform X2 [Salvia hispanica]|uniref:C2 and GRAM domain-containing protein At1g03370-like isoform X2 n=1 Tax=Salvia hispanica TaxID=49212 RepID=UPI0020098EC4|nr:C2 and GRAM domain-containing protein At1g03370-like isoform X2 [Salvia hispanica]